MEYDPDRKTFTFTLISPEDEFISVPSTLTVMPAAEGHMGVMADHQAMVVIVRPGVVTVHRPDKPEPREVFVAWGVADITPGKCVLLAEEVSLIENLSLAHAQDEVDDILAELATGGSIEERAPAEKRLAVAEARLRAAEKVYGAAA